MVSRYQLSRRRRGPKISKRRGALLATTIMVLMVFSVVGLSLAASSMQAVRMTRFQEEQSAAFNLAESGADRALLWIKSQSAPPSATTAFNPFGGAIKLGRGTYSVTVDGDDVNPSLDYKRYVIRSTGVVNGRHETVELYVRQSNFGRYAYFTDKETSSLTGEAIWFKSGETIDGPAHSNNTDGTIFNINWSNSGEAIFKSNLTGSGSWINYAPSAPSGESEFQKIFADGTRGYQLGVARIELPDSTDRQKIAAWGSSSGFPSSEGVYVNSAGSVPLGGIYVRASSAQVRFVDEGSEAQQRIEITVGSRTYKIRVNRSANRTEVFRGSGSNSDSTKVTYNGVPNGVIYCTGDITSLKGTITDSLVEGTTIVSRNAWTVATDIVGGKNVKIKDDLVYKTKPDKNRGWDDVVNLKAGCLGVVARNIILDTSNTDLTIHGVMLAGGRNTSDGSFYNAEWDEASPGTLTLLGGIIQKARGPVGTFRTSTGEQATGFEKNYTYDTRMAVNPPPFFPTTGNYDRLSWTRQSAGAAR